MLVLEPALRHAFEAGEALQCAVSEHAGSQLAVEASRLRAELYAAYDKRDAAYDELDAAEQETLAESRSSGGGKRSRRKKTKTKKTRGDTNIAP